LDQPNDPTKWCKWLLTNQCGMVRRCACMKVNQTTVMCLLLQSIFRLLTCRKVKHNERSDYWKVAAINRH